MKQGLSLTELAAKVEADEARKHDMIVDTRKVAVLTTPEGGSTLHLTETGAELDMLHHTHRQIGQRLGIRADFYDRLRTDLPDVHTQLVNGMLHGTPQTKTKGRFQPGPYMIRTYTDGGTDGRGVARAFLSNKYHRVDHGRILNGVLPVIMGLKDAGHEVRVMSCDVTDSKLYLKVVIPSIGFDLNDYVNKPLPGGDDQVVQVGFVILNSEVGTGAFDVQKLVYRRVCQNGMIAGSAMSRRHVGRRIGEDEDLSIYQDDTLKADDEAMQLKLRDTLKAIVDETKFELLVKEFAGATETKPMEEPIKAMEALAPVVALTGNELTKATQHLLRDGDLTKFGAVNAITRMAQDVESYDRSTELEELAATHVLRMNNKDWEAIATAA